MQRLESDHCSRRPPVRLASGNAYLRRVWRLEGTDEPTHLLCDLWTAPSGFRPRASSELGAHRINGLPLRKKRSRPPGRDLSVMRIYDRELREAGLCLCALDGNQLCRPNTGHSDKRTSCWHGASGGCLAGKASTRARYTGDGQQRSASSKSCRDVPSRRCNCREAYPHTADLTEHSCRA